MKVSTPAFKTLKDMNKTEYRGHRVAGASYREIGNMLYDKGVRTRTGKRVQETSIRSWLVATKKRKPKDVRLGDSRKLAGKWPNQEPVKVSKTPELSLLSEILESNLKDTTKHRLLVILTK